QPIDRFRCVTKTRRKLKKNAPELAGFGERRDALFEFVDICLGPSVFLVCELLPGFDSELEVVWRPLRPTLRSFRSAWPVKRGIDFHCVEVPRIELQFIGPRERIEESCP